MSGNEGRKISSLRDLPRDIAPPRDLWQGIEARIAADQRAELAKIDSLARPSLREARTGRLRLLAAAAVIVALAVGTMLLTVSGVIPQLRAIWCLLFFLPLVLAFLMKSEKALFACLNLFPLLLTLGIWL